jgi:hypothetical protein
LTFSDKIISFKNKVIKMEMSDVEVVEMRRHIGESKSRKILPPKIVPFLLIFKRECCPRCGKKLKTRYFKESWRINGIFWIFYKYCECSCGYRYVKETASIGT